MVVKTESELAAFYSRELLPALRLLEEKRKKIANGYYMIGGVVVATLLLVFLFGILERGLWWLLLFPGTLVGWFGISTYGQSSIYTAEFKSAVIARLVKFLDESLEYGWKSSIPIETYYASKIFLQHVDRYSGDDLVSGKLDKTAIAFSELHSEYKTETRDSKGNIQTQWHTIFKGLFFIADFNKEFKGCTVVLPDTAEKLFGFLGNMLQKMNMARGQLIKLEDPEFEKEFAVYGDDQITARYILSASLMERMLEFKKKTGKQVYFSFVQSRVYVAVSYNRSLFEPKIFSSLVDYKTIREYYGDLAMATGIVEDLNLNTRIWSKE